VVLSGDHLGDCREAFVCKGLCISALRNLTREWMCVRARPVDLIPRFMNWKFQYVNMLAVTYYRMFGLRLIGYFCVLRVTGTCWTTGVQSPIGVGFSALPQHPDWLGSTKPIHWHLTCVLNRLIRIFKEFYMMIFSQLSLFSAFFFFLSFFFFFFFLPLMSECICGCVYVCFGFVCYCMYCFWSQIEII
jgi:hypothetical protein